MGVKLFFLTSELVQSTWWLYLCCKQQIFTVYIIEEWIYIITNRIGGVIVSVLASIAVDRGLEPRSGQTRL